MSCNLERGIILTGYIFQKEAGLLALEHKEELEQRYAKGFVRDMIAQADAKAEEAREILSKQKGNCQIFEMKAAGLFPTLWDAAEEYKKGLEIDVKAIKIKQETVEVCEFLDLNPYEFPSKESLLVVSDRPLETLFLLEQKGVAAAIIGRLTDSKARILRNGERVRYLDKHRGPKE